MDNLVRFALGLLALSVAACGKGSGSNDDDGGGRGGESATSGGTAGASPTGGAGGSQAANGGTTGGAPAGAPNAGASATSGAGSGGVSAAGQGGLGGVTAGAPAGGTGGGALTDIPALHVEGTKLLDPDGKTVVLRGIDLIDLGMVYAYNGESAEAVKARIDKILAAGFTPRVVRIPVYPRVSHNGNYPYASPMPFPSGTGGVGNGPSADEYMTKVLRPAVDYLTGKGLYVIIDYHQIDDTDGASATEAGEFWQYMAPQFASYTNVLYEPFNEPMDTGTSWSVFKPRAQSWVDVIRSAAPENIVIVPSMQWDQRPGDAAGSPLTGKNLMYTMHVYPSNWTATTKQQLATAVAAVPVFLTEWGYMLNSTDSVGGTSDAAWFTNFRSVIDGNGASWSAWVTDHEWTPNLFASADFGMLTDFGEKTRTWLSETAVP
jgi:hypothetical protein